MRAALLQLPLNSTGKNDIIGDSLPSPVLRLIEGGVSATRIWLL